jgi:hypothetical protein
MLVARQLGHGRIDVFPEIRLGHAEPHARERQRGDAQRPAGHGVVDQHAVVHAARHHAGGVEGRRDRHQPFVGPAVHGRAKADQPAVRGRHAHRAARVGADGRRRGAQPEQRRVAAAGAARDARRIERVARRPEGVVVPGDALRPLVQVGLAEHQRAGVQQALRHARVNARPVVGHPRAARGGRHAGDVDVVLEGQRHAMQGQRAGGRARPRVQCRGRGQQRRRFDVEQRAESHGGLGALQQRLCVVGRAQIAACHLFGCLARGKIGQRMDSVHEGFEIGAGAALGCMFRANRPAELPQTC